MSADAGRLVGGRYRLGGVLGRGGMGTVWRGEDEILGRAVAVKELRFPSVVDEDEKQRLITRTLREAKAIARIRSSSAITVFDVVDEDGRPWIVMELVEGRSLADRIRKDGPLAPRRAAEVGLAILDVLRAAHREGILHRDVKPSNVLLEEGTDRVVLTDWGIAKVEGDPSVTSTGMLVGAPSYISPERARGQPPGPPADLWSLGGLLYAAVEGHPPYDKGSAISTLTAVMTEPVPVPEKAGDLSEAIYGLLTKDPEKRLDVDGARALLEPVAAGDRVAVTRAGSGSGSGGTVGGADSGAKSSTATKGGRSDSRRDSGSGSGSGSGSAGGGRGAAGAAASASGTAGGSRASKWARRSASSLVFPGRRRGERDTVPPPSAEDPAADAAESAAPAESAGAAESAPGGGTDSASSAPSAAEAGPDTDSGSRPASDSDSDEGPGAAADSGAESSAGVAGGSASESAGAADAKTTVAPATSAAPGPPSSGSASGSGPGLGAGVAVPAAVAALLERYPRRTVASVAAGALAVLVVLIVLLVLLVGGAFGGDASGSGGGKPSSSGSAEGAKDAAGKSGEGDGSGTDKSDDAGSGSGSGDEAGKGGGKKDDGKDEGASGLPDGYSTVVDHRFHFRLALPEGFKRTGVAGQNSGGKYSGGGLPKIQVDYSDSPLKDAAAGWRKQEPAVRGASSGYHRISLKSVKWRGYPTVADWQFERTEDGHRVRVLNRGFKVDGSHGYAILITCRAGAWDDKKCRTLRETAFKTFSPAD